MMYELTDNQKKTLKKQGYVYITRNGKKIRVTPIMVSNYMPYPEGSKQRKPVSQKYMSSSPTSAINKATDLALMGVGAAMAIQIGTSMLGLLPTNK
jgi:hypothetical protein